MNQRDDFRVALINKRCLVLTNVLVSDCLIENISGTGISIKSPVDEFQGVFKVQFSVHGRSFLRNVDIEWKEVLPSGETVYGLSFFDQTDPERVYLHSVLMTEAAIAFQEKKAVGSY